MAPVESELDSTGSSRSQLRTSNLNKGIDDDEIMDVLLKKTKEFFLIEMKNDSYDSDDFQIIIDVRNFEIYIPCLFYKYIYFFNLVDYFLTECTE